jgi:type 1 fimbria pilin
MLALLLTTALMANENATTHPASQTITFSGVVPTATCEIDKYADEKLHILYKPIKCPDKKQVFIKKESVVLDGNIIDAWVIEYENIK